MRTASVNRLLFVLLVLVTTLRFTTPNKNEDGTPCTDLDSMRLYSTAIGRAQAHVQHQAGVPDSFRTDGSGGIYGVKAVDTHGNESQMSNQVQVGQTADVPIEPPPVVPVVYDRCGGRP